MSRRRWRRVCRCVLQFAGHACVFAMPARVRRGRLAGGAFGGARDGKGVPSLLVRRGILIYRLAANICAHSKLLKGTRVLLLAAEGKVARVARVDDVRDNGDVMKVFELPRIFGEFKMNSGRGKQALLAVRRQFPLVLCVAGTVDAAQGTTRDRVAVDLRRSLWSRGHLYCALTRGRSLDGMLLLATAKDVVQEPPYGNSAAWKRIRNGTLKANRVVTTNVVLPKPLYGL